MTNQFTKIFKDLITDLVLIRSQFHFSDVQKEEKDDGSPVTELDKALNDSIVAHIKKHYPNDGIVTEEIKEPHKGTSNRVWFVDPLDGTKEFIKGLEEWAVQIGLVENNEVIFGLVAPLDRKVIYYATKGEGAYRSDLSFNNPQKIMCSEVTDTKSLRAVVSRSRTEKKTLEVFNSQGITHLIPMGSLGVKLSCIAEGNADLYILMSGQCNLWDICAPEIIVTEAGGFVGHPDGSSVNYNYTTTTELGKSLIACNKNIFHDIIKAL